MSALEQNDVKLSFRNGPSADITDVLTPVSRSTAKPVLDEEPSSGDSEIKTHTTPSVKIPAATPTGR